MISKKRSILLVLVLVFVQFSIGTDTTFCQDSESQAIKALHVFNFKDGTGEQQYLSIINEFNQLYKRLGHPGIKYQVWKELEGRNGDYEYIQESTWPDKATYDKIHNDPEYKKLAEKYKDAWGKLGIEQVYNRYSPLN